VISCYSGIGPSLLQYKSPVNAHCEPSATPAAGILAAYGSFAPSTANLFADSSIVCFLDTATSLIAGFVVFSVLGNFATEHNKIVAANPNLRVNICLDAISDSSANKLGGGSAAQCPTECAMCRGLNWMDYGSCCGSASIADVVQAKVALAFVVRLDLFLMM
jgi:hypothetical protein